MNLNEVTVIDYGVGNLLSVRRAFEHCGAKVITTADPDKILRSARVVLPGVGAFADAMRALESLGLVPIIRELAQNKTPLLGICLGMQLLLESSSEFEETAGLGLIPGRVIPIPNTTKDGTPHKIPHIGWVALQPSNSIIGWNGTLLQDHCLDDAVYFVHSFMAAPENPSHRIADCIYGGHAIAATIGIDNITGCQFHPEKSGHVGLRIIRRFCLD